MSALFCYHRRIVDKAQKRKHSEEKVGKNKQMGRRVRINLSTAPVFFFPIFKNNGTPSGVPDFSCIPKKSRPKCTTGRAQPEAKEAANDHRIKRDPT